MLPTLDTVLRRAIDQWLYEQGITPYIVGEFADSALLKVFGQEGKGIFFAPDVIEKEILSQYEVAVVGRTEAVKEQFFAITAERRIKHPAVNHIREMASSTLFNLMG